MGSLMTDFPATTAFAYPAGSNSAAIRRTTAPKRPPRQMAFRQYGGSGTNAGAAPGKPRGGQGAAGGMDGGSLDSEMRKNLNHHLSHPDGKTPEMVDA